MNRPNTAAPVAGLGRRAAAVLLDGLVAVLAGGWLWLATSAQAGLRAVQGRSADGAGPDVPGWLVAACGAALVVVVLVQWVLHGRLGWTLGRRAVGIRTVDERTRRPIGMARVLLRGLVVAAGSLALGVGQLVVLISPLFDSSGRRRGWHDQAARSLVVDVRGPAGTGTPPPPRPEVAQAPTALAWRGPAGATSAPAGRPAETPWTAPPPPPGPPAAPPPAGQGRHVDAPPAPAVAHPPTAPLVLAPLAQHRAGPDLDTRAMPIIAAGPAAVLGATPPVPPPPAAPDPVTPVPAPPASAGVTADAPRPGRPAFLAGVPGASAPPPADELEDVEATRRHVPGVRPGDEPEPEPGPAGAVVEISDGQRVLVQHTALVGRNPAAAADGVQLVRVVDPTRSVSKTHLQLAVEPSGVWVADRGSTNGTVVTLPDGAQVICPVDQPVRLRVGAVVVFGDCALRLVEATV